MGLNQNFVSQGDRPLPVIFGYAVGAGDSMLSITDTTNAQIAFVAIADGDCDGIEQFALTDESPLYTLGGHVPANLGGVTITSCLRFHSGTWTPIGLNTSESSAGPNQGVDTWFASIPTLTPPQSFNNVCYVALRLPLPVGPLVARNGVFTPYPLKFFGIVRGARCRYFDTNGNVTGYGFTTNPVWHRVEMILRYKIKRQQPQIAGLTDAEKACFNWPSIVALAARNDFILPGGQKRFVGNYVFAANATLTSMLETSCRCDRSYIPDNDPSGKISMYGFDATDSAFMLTASHIYPGTFKVQKKNLTTAPNIFVPKFRDLNIAAQIPVVFVTNANGGNTEGTRTLPNGVWCAYFNTNGDSPFVNDYVFYYGDNPTDASFNGDFVGSGNPDPAVAEPEVWGTGLIGIQKTIAGGYIGSQTSRFGQRAPATVQHRRHQAAASQVAPGVSAGLKTKTVTYDLGNMTYEQANRLMKYQRDSTLGSDVVGWKAPVTGSVRVKLEAASVDNEGEAFIAMRPRQGDRGDGFGMGRFKVSPTVSVEFGPNLTAGSGEYTITKMTIIPPCRQAPLGAIDVEFETYNHDAPTDVSDPPDDSFRTIASAALPLVNASLMMTNVSWTIQSTTDMSAWSGNVAIPDLAIQVLGETTYRNYPTAAWTGIPSSGPVTLYVDDAGGGTAPSFGWQPNPLPLLGPPAYRYAILTRSQ